MPKKIEDDKKVHYGDVVGKSGPKYKYEPWMCDKIKEVAQEGLHVSHMCAAIGINSEDTFHRWKREIPEFGAAYEEAKTLSKGVYEKLLLSGAMGQIPGFNFNAVAMIMNNKFPEEYKRNANGNGPTEITINTMNLSSDQLELKIAQKMEKLKSMGIELLDDKK